MQGSRRLLGQLQPQAMTAPLALGRMAGMVSSGTLSRAMAMALQLEMPQRKQPGHPQERHRSSRRHQSMQQAQEKGCRW